MNIRKPLLVVGAITAISGIGIGGSSLVSAQTSGSDQDSLANKIAQKFNLKSDDVKAVFDEDRQAKEAEQTTKVTAELDTLVKDGKLTTAQKDAIVAKRAELQKQRETDRDSMKDKTEAERKTAMDAKKTDLDNWAKQNNIPSEYTRYVMGGHGGPGGGRGGMMGGEKPADSSQSTTTTN